MEEFETTWRMRLDAGDFRGVAAQIEAEITRLRGLALGGAAPAQLKKEAAPAAAASQAMATGRSSQGTFLGGADAEVKAAGAAYATEIGSLVTFSKAEALQASRRVAMQTELADLEATQMTAARLAAEETSIGTRAKARIAELDLLQQADTETLVELTRQRIQSERRINEIEKQVEAEARGQIRAAEGQGAPGLTQRLQAFAGGNKKDPEEYRGLGQILGSRFITSGTFAVSGFATFTALQQIRGLVEEAQKAQLVMGQLQAEFTALGQADEFPRMRDEVLGFARDLGIAADQALEVGITMKGAFQDTDEAIAATHEALVAMTVGGLSTAEVRNLFVAIPEAFDLGTAEIKGMNDELLHLQDVFGVTEKEIATGVGNIAPLAHELGLSFKETSTIIAAATASSGRSAQQVASEIGRAVTQIQKNAPAILQIFSQSNVSSFLPKIQSAFATGDTGQVLVQVFRAWDQLNESQKNAFVTMVGGRREAASLAAALGQSSRIVHELDDNSSHAGRSALSLAAYQKTLAAALREAREEFRQLGEALTRAGIATLFSDMVHFGGAVIGVIAGMVRVLASLNSITHGAVARFGEFLLLIYAINRIHAIDFVVNLLSQLPRLITYLRALAAAEEGEAAAGLAGGAANIARGLGGAVAARFGGQAAGTAIATGGGIPGAIGGAGGAVPAALATEAPAAGALTIGTGVGVAAAAAGALMIAEFEREKKNVAKKIKAVTEQYQKLSDEEIEKAIRSEGNKPIADRGPLQAFGSGQTVGGEGIGSQIAARAGQLATALGVNLPHDIGQLSNLAHGRFGDFAKGLPVVSLFTHPGEDRRKKILEGIKNQRLAESEKDQINALIDANFMKPEDYDTIQSDLQKIAESGDKDATKDLQSRLKRLSATPQGKAAIQKMQDAKTITDQQTQLFGQLGLTTTNGIQSLEELDQAYSDGDISQTQYVDALQGQIDALQGVTSKGGTGPEILKQLAALKKKQSDAIVAQAKAQQELATESLTLSGVDPTQAALTAAASLYNTPGLTDQARAAAFKDLVNAQNAQNQYALKQANTIETINKLLDQGFDIDPKVREAVVRQSTVDPVTGSKEWQAIAGKLAGNLKGYGISMDSIIQAAVAGNESVKQAAAEAIQKEIAGAQAALQNVKNPSARQEIQGSINTLNALLAQVNAAPDVATPGAGQGLTTEQRLSEIQARQRIEEATVNARKATLVGDPVGQARADAKQAQVELAELEKEGIDHGTEAYQNALQKKLEADTNLRQATQKMRDLDASVRSSALADDPVAQAQNDYAQALDDLAKAVGPEERANAQILVNQRARALRQATQEQNRSMLEYQRTLDEGNPVQAANDNVAIAQAAVNAAVAGTAAWYSAQAQLVQAQRDVSRAQLQMFTAQLDVNKAIAQAAGDQVGVATIELQEAQAQLAEAQARGNQYDTLQAQARVISAQAGVVSAQIQTGERDIDFALQMQQISTSQAITELEALLRIPGITKEQTQQILLKINQLRQDASKDLQFDIPTDIKLPTLYEVRRLRQSEQAGYGYNDNRQIQVQYNVYSPMDHQATMSDLADVLDGNRTGVAPRTYP